MIAILLFFYSLYRLPVLFDGALNLLLNISYISFFIFVIFLRLPSIIKIKEINIRYFLIVMAFLIWGQLSFVRTFVNGHIEIFNMTVMIVWQWIILLLAISMVSRLKNIFDLENLLRSLMVGASIYLVLNLILAFLGIRGC